MTGPWPLTCPTVGTSGRGGCITPKSWTDGSGASGCAVFAGTYEMAAASHTVDREGGGAAHPDESGEW